jgi:hypothetical protein
MVRRHTLKLWVTFPIFAYEIWVTFYGFLASRNTKPAFSRRFMGYFSKYRNKYIIISIG